MRRGIWASALLGAAMVACGGAATPVSDARDVVDASSPDTSTTASTPDAATPSGDAASPTPPDASEDAGPPATRNTTCTPLADQTGTLVDTGYGRMDGTLVYVLPLGGASDCNGDNSHIHLQVEMKGLIYDVAVDVGSTGDNVGTYQATETVPGGVWSEGWHGADQLSYPSFSISSSELPIVSDVAQVAATVTSALETVSKISIFCTGYSQENGCHDVHYQHGTGDDGAIVLDPTSASSPMLFFRFEAQSF